MTLYLAIAGLGFVLLVIVFAALIWAVNDGQLDDLDTPPLRMLADDCAPGTDRSLSR